MGSVRTADAGRRKRAPRFVEIARKAGVSVTTVDRVLNERGSVSVTRTRRVLDAARSLGVKRILPSPHHGLFRIATILVQPESHLFARLNEAFSRASGKFGRSVVVDRIFVAEGDHRQMADGIVDALRFHHGVIVCAQEDERIRVALKTAAKQGVPVVTLVSDVTGAPRLAYVGIDNYAAGRTAAYFLGRFAKRPGRVLILCNALAYLVHAERVTGFTDAMGEQFPDIEVLAPLRGRDLEDVSYDLVRRALRTTSDVVGIYNSGGASEALVAAIHDAGRAGEMVFIGHELTDANRGFLDEGAMDIVIDQDPDRQSETALRHLLSGAGIIDTSVPQGPVPFKIFTRENQSDGR